MLAYEINETQNGIKTPLWKQNWRNFPQHSFNMTEIPWLYLNFATFRKFHYFLPEFCHFPQIPWPFSWILPLSRKSLTFYPNFANFLNFPNLLLEFCHLPEIPWLYRNFATFLKFLVFVTEFCHFHEIPWLFPEFCVFPQISWLFTRILPLSLTSLPSYPNFANFLIFPWLFSSAAINPLRIPGFQAGEHILFR